jgi:hypothetical protein
MKIGIHVQTPNDCGGKNSVCTFKKNSSRAPSIFYSLTQYYEFRSNRILVELENYVFFRW